MVQTACMGQNPIPMAGYSFLYIPQSPPNLGKLLLLIQALNVLTVFRDTDLGIQDP